MADEPESNPSGDVSGAASSGGIKSKVKDLLSKSSGGGSGGSGQSGPAGRYAAIPDNLKKGGKIRKSGYARVHKGERVLNKRQAKRYGKRNRRKN
jgi:hypothetical protein